MILRFHVPTDISILFPLLFLRQLHDLPVFSYDIRVIFPLVRQHTSGTVFDPVLRITEIAAAALSERIQRTITEQTVKILRIFCFMTRKIFAFLMTEKGILFLRINPLFLCSSFFIYYFSSIYFPRSSATLAS